jgi:hypothetical protein
MTVHLSNHLQIPIALLNLILRMKIEKRDDEKCCVCKLFTPKEIRESPSLSVKM